MIVPMKHVSLLCLGSETEKALQELRALGVLHVKTRPAAGDSLADAQDAVRKAETALHTLEMRLHHHQETTAEPPTPPENLVDEVLALQQRAHELTEQSHHCHVAIQALLPFGTFDPAAIQELRQKGVYVKLLRVSEPEHLSVPEGIVIQELSHTLKGVYLAAIAEHDFEIDGTLNTLPQRSLKDLQQEEQELRQETERIEAELIALAPHAPALKREWLQRQETLAFRRVHESMDQHGPIASITGFCPAQKAQIISEAAGKHGWALSVRDPDPGEDVPTLLQMPAWVRPIKAVLQMLSILPGYREADISGVFLVFFSIFFAILIGDAGYGILFLVLTLIARAKLPKAPAYPFVLFGILSICTLTWGAITGNWFGIPTAALPGPLQSLQLEVLSGEAARNHVIRLCFLIGAIHLTIAHIWNAIALAPSLKALAQIGWIGLVWSMFFTALNMVLGLAYPAFFLPLFIASVLLILLFMTAPRDLKAEWINHAMFPLSIVNCFVDIVSYIRLFAVGMASLSVAASFNDMAMQIGLARIWTVPLVALILLLGHGLNILLCALGILVHGVRLNTLEFSLHKNIEWKGFAYEPFASLSQKSQ